MLENYIVYEFEVPQNLGFGYCKIVDFRNKRVFDGLLAKVFDYLSPKPIVSLDILVDKDWLFGARRLAQMPSIKGKGAWRRIGSLISQDDNIIPDFKSSNKLSPLIEDESKINEWQVIRNINEVCDKKFSYNDVRHLEDTTINSTYGIEIRTAMEYFRINNLDIKERFDLSDMTNWNVYRGMINVPIYKTIPPPKKGKAIC
ncbi:MAG: hypothetical protein GXC73_12905 [Chitinophagaceae bacterium]|nr:hypothetical protein [Chitinophagaceae bacterium]